MVKETRLNGLQGLLCILALTISGPVAALETATADEIALLRAWENAQRNDPKTVRFEQTAPRVYRLKTERFPYDGSVEVASLVVQDSPGQAARWGTVEVRLDQPIAELREQFPASFALWSLNNHFIKDAQSGKWTTYAESRRVQETRTQALPWLKRVDTVALGVGSAVLLVFACVWAGVRYQLAVVQKLREDEQIRTKLLSERDHSAGLDSRILSALEQQQSLLDDVLAAQHGDRRWRPRVRSSAGSSAVATHTPASIAPTKLQRERLSLYLALRDRDDASAYLRAQKAPRRVWIARGVVALTFIGLLMLGATKALLFASGLVLGFVLMAWTTRETFVQTWPALRAALDWRKVEELLRQPVSPPPTRASGEQS